MVEKAAKRRLSRRTFLKGSAATGAVIAGGPIFAPAVHAAAQRSRSAMSARRPVRSRLSARPTSSSSTASSKTRGQLNLGGDDYSVEVDRQGQPVRPEPRGRGRQGPHRHRRDRHDARRLDAGDHQPGRRAVRDRGRALRLHRGAVAALLHRPPSDPGDPASWKPFDFTYHFFWGLEDVIAVYTNMWGQLETNKSVGGLFPNDGDGNAWGDKQVGFPPVLDEGLHAHRPRPLPEPHRRLHGPDQRLQGSELRDHHRRRPAARLHHLLEPGQPAGLQAEGVTVGKAILFPVAVEALGENGNNLSSEVWWSPNHPFKSSLTGPSANDLAMAYQPRPASSGRSRSASSTRCSRSRSTR